MPEPKQIIEALLFASSEPITPQKLKEILEVADVREVKKEVDALRQEYEQQGRAFSIEEVGGGYLLVSRPEYGEWISRIRKKKAEGKLSPASMETLAIIAYKQPISRAEVESIRGVQIGSVLQGLLERDLIRISGRSETLGQSFLYSTTRKFLETFGLNTIRDLPSLEEFGFQLPLPASDASQEEPQEETPEEPVSEEAASETNGTA